MERQNVTSPPTFDEVLEVIDHLPLDQQAELLLLVKKRIAAQRRRQIAKDIEEGQAEFDAGGLHPSSVADIMREIDS